MLVQESSYTTQRFARIISPIRKNATMDYSNKSLHVKIRNGLLLALFMSLMVSCDTLQDDASPSGDELLDLEVDRQIQSGTSVLFDLKAVTNASSTVDFRIDQQASRGDLNFLEEGLLQYKPNSNFLSGSDLFSVQVVSEGAVLDTDTVVIEMVNDSTNLPCFGGALSEFFVLNKNQSILFNPLLNDGYCPDETAEVLLSFDQPANGTVEIEHYGSIAENVGYELFYVPDEDFVGVDAFLYQVTFIDLEGVSHSSSALVEMTIIEDPMVDGCDIWPNQELTFTGPIETYYEFPITFEQAFCTFLPHYLEIVSVSTGYAEFFEGQTMMRYYTDSAVNIGSMVNTGPVEKVRFDIVFEDLTRIHRTITLNFPDVQVTCPVANPDVYLFETNVDSTGLDAYTWYFDPAENDNKCSENYRLELLSSPFVGTISLLNDDQLMKLEVQEEFAGSQNFQVTYEICDGGVCDTAQIDITVDKS